MPFHHHPILVELDITDGSYRLMQVRERKLIIFAENKKQLLLRRGEFFAGQKNTFAENRRNGSLQMITESRATSRQIWLVDMKVKL